ncbi:MAG: hypothetical protein DVB23_001745 [Verrucomicrobia bacterium]|nr:MAG: hypothetical protein DVB23_001745 [Verrucomicrobiota bacterium]
MITLSSSGWVRRLALLSGLWVSVLIAGEGSREQGATITVPGGGTKEDAGFDLFPVGKPWRDVRLPRYDEKDRLTSIMHSEILTREARQLLQMEGLTLAMFEPDRTLSLRLKTAKGIYDLATKELKTRTKTFIEHPRFDMQGDSLIFDTGSGKGKLNGNVEMVIYASSLEKLQPPGGMPGQ